MIETPRSPRFFVHFHGGFRSPPVAKQTARILGCSTYGRPELVEAALNEEVKADYLGSGAIFATPTKASEAKVWRWDGFGSRFLSKEHFF